MLVSPQNETCSIEFQNRKKTDLPDHKYDWQNTVYCKSFVFSDNESVVMKVWQVLKSRLVSQNA